MPKSQTPDTKYRLGYGDYLRFRDLVLKRSGLYFPEKKRIDLETGLFKALATTSALNQKGGYNLDEYYNLLCDRSNPASQTEMDRLIKALTVGETHFFRDQTQFDALAAHVLPALVARKRAAAEAVGAGIQPQLRIWSTGCATGEEPYSVAILLKELLPDLENWNILILATDINSDALARAREALYSDWSFREIRAKALRPHYFTLEPDTRRYRLRPDIRQMVTFATLNLIEDDYPTIANNTSSMDLILCRNVTIYFTEEITQQVVNRFYEALNGRGWLVVGHSEPSLFTYRAFQTHTFQGTLFYQKTGQASPWPATWEGLTAADGLNKTSFTGTVSASVNQGKSVDNPGNLPPVQTQNNGGSVSLAPLPLSQPQKDSSLAKSKEPVVPPPSSDPYELAQLLLQKGRVEEAITELRHKLSVHPNFAPAHSLLGLAHANLGNWTEARQWCQSALKLNNLLAEAYYVLGLVYQQEGDIESAINMLKKAIYIDRQAPLFHFNLGTLYRQQGQTELARRTYNNVIRILEKWSPDTIIPDSGGMTTKHLLDTTRRILEGR